MQKNVPPPLHDHIPSDESSTNEMGKGSSSNALVDKDGGD